MKNKDIESGIENLRYVHLKKEVYERPGVWALYGLKNSGEWVCLEVAQTVNVYQEIWSAIHILITPEEGECIGCDNVHKARRRFKDYSVSFDVHNCKKCPNTSSLRRKSRKRNPRYIDKYKDIGSRNYEKVKFICVNMSNDMYDIKKRKAVEKEYAEENKALYWYN